MNNTTIRYEENFAYDKPITNNLVISKTHQESNMNKERNAYFETEQNGMTVIFLFPPKNRKEDNVDEQSPFTQQRKEVKNILTTILPEYLTKGGKTL